MTGPQRSLYRFLRQKVQQPGRPVTQDFPMPVGWRELVIGEERSRKPVLDGRQDSGAAATGTQRRRQADVVPDRCGLIRDR